MNNKNNSGRVVADSKRGHPYRAISQRGKDVRRNRWRFTVQYKAAIKLSPEKLAQVFESVQKEFERLGYAQLVAASTPSRIYPRLKKSPRPKLVPKGEVLVREKEEQLPQGGGAILQLVQAQLEASGFPTQPAERERILEDVLAASFRKRQELLSDTLTAPQVADLLNTSRQTPLNRAEKGSLLAIYDNGKWLFPRWQFDTQGADGVLPGLARVLQALDVSPFAKLSWFLRGSPYLEERTPLDVLKSGDIERLVTLAQAVGGE